MRGLRFASQAFGYSSLALAAIALLPGGCPSESGGVVDGQTVAETGTNCWDANGDGVNDPNEDVNADGLFDSDDCHGADGQNGANGPAGADGIDGFNGAQGASGLQGSSGSDGADGAAGEQGPPGPIDTTQPTAVTSLLVRRSPLGPPFYDLAWDYIGAGVTLSHFNVYVSSTAISSGNKAAALWSSTTPSERTASLWIPADSGQCYIRVTAVSYTGVESAFSDEKVVDTTSRIVFLADMTNDGSFELFEGTPTGAAPASLSGPLPPGQSVSTNHVTPSPDGLRVAYVADADSDEVQELYVVDFATSSRVKLSPTPVTGGDVWGFRWSPDGTHLAYLGDLATDDVVELWVVSAAGGNSTRVSGATVATSDVSNYDWSPDGKRIAFTSDRETDTLLEAFVTDDQGSTLTKISGTRSVGESVDFLRWSPDSTRVAFSAYDSPTTMSLSVANSTGGTVTNLSGATMGVIWYYFRWSPDGRRFAFQADYDGSGVYRLFTVPAVGGIVSDVSGVIVAGGDSNWFAWSPDGSHLAFVGDKDTDGMFELYVASPGGGGVSKLSGTLVANGSVQGSDFAWSPDGSRLLFAGDVQTDGVVELFTVGLGGDAPLKVSGTLVANGDVVTFSSNWSPDGTRILFRADKDTDEWFETYSVGFLGGEVTKVNTTLSATADVMYANWASVGFKIGGATD